MKTKLSAIPVAFLAASLGFSPTLPVFAGSRTNETALNNDSGNPGLFPENTIKKAAKTITSDSSLSSDANHNSADQSTEDDLNHILPADGSDSNASEEAESSPTIPELPDDSNDQNDIGIPDLADLDPGWHLYNARWFYVLQDHTLAQYWKKIEDSWYYFNKSGIMQTGPVAVDQEIYLLSNSGQLTSGWLYHQNDWYYTDPGEVTAHTGWLQLNNKWYYLEPETAKMHTGWLYDGNSRYYLDLKSGAIKTGWVYTDSHWYYFSLNGQMKTGWLYLNDGTYYLNKDGTMAAGSLEINGTSYQFSSSGRLASDMQGLKRNLEAYIAANKMASEDWSVSVFNLSTRDHFEIHDHTQQAASVIKLFVAGCVLENYETLIQSAPSATIDSLLHDMITLSSNDVWYLLGCALGNDDWGEGCRIITAWARDHGYSQTSSPGGIGANYTSVLDTGKLVQDLFDDKLTGSRTILDLMKQQTRTWKLPAGLPEGVTSGNKTGELYDTENDVLIVWGKTPYCLSVMTTGVYNQVHAFEMMKEISATVYKAMEE